MAKSTHINLCERRIFSKSRFHQPHQKFSNLSVIPIASNHPKLNRIHFCEAQISNFPNSITINGSDLYFIANKRLFINHQTSGNNSSKKAKQIFTSNLSFNTTSHVLQFVYILLLSLFISPVWGLVRYAQSFSPAIDKMFWRLNDGRNWNILSRFGDPANYTRVSHRAISLKALPRNDLTSSMQTCFLN